MRGTAVVAVQTRYSQRVTVYIAGIAGVTRALVQYMYIGGTYSAVVEYCIVYVHAQQAQLC